MYNRRTDLPKIVDLLRESKEVLLHLHQKVDEALGAENIFDDEKDYVINVFLDVTQSLEEVRSAIGQGLDMLEGL